MNVSKEPLHRSEKLDLKSTEKKTRRNHLKTNRNIDESINSSENRKHDIELGAIDSDLDDDSTKLETRRILRSRHLKHPTTATPHNGGSIVIVEKPVRPNETIQAFAIRYRVPISQLKRLNNLQNDQDFYALRYCRVPVRRFGLFHETSSSSSIVVNLDEQAKANATLSAETLSKQDHHAFLSAMDHDFASMRAKTQQLIITQPATLIPDQPTAKMMIRSTTKSFADLNCDGADCGCKFWHVILAILLVALLIPLIYIYIFVKSPPETIDHFP